jgi:hypothetical protein
MIGMFGLEYAVSRLKYGIIYSMKFQNPKSKIKNPNKEYPASSVMNYSDKSIDNWYFMPYIKS